MEKMEKEREQAEKDELEKKRENMRGKFDK